MPFGLTNAPSTFQDMMNHVLSDLLDVGVLAYMDDILVFAVTREEHDRLVTEVFQRLRDNGLAVSPEKCVWRAQEVEFLGYVIGREGIKMANNKVEAVLSWKTPGSLTEVQLFLSFANFYQCFIKDYSKVARPLAELTKKNEGKKWAWNEEAEAAFLDLKRRFTTAPILSHFDAARPVIIEIDASDFAIEAVLSQRDEENRLHLVAFHSRKFQPVEINYEIHDKELLAMVDAFKYWRRYCEGAQHQVQVFSDHQNLEYFTTTKVLNRRQARWAQELAGIDFRIYYRPGTQNGKPDALSRYSEYCPEKGGIENQPISTVLQENHFAESERQGRTFICSSARLASLPGKKWTQEFLTEIRKEGKKDRTYEQAMKQEAVIEEPSPKDRKVKEIRKENELLYRKNLLWVPERLVGKILESEHDTKVAGHMGQDKTIELIRRNFWWPKMNERIIDFVQSRPECQQNKASRHWPYGLSSPLELSYAPWQSIAMDFITELPVSEGCDQLWVVIDRFTKMAHFIPLKEKMAADLTKIFAREIWRFHGLPTDIVSDRDLRFTSEVWKEFLRLLGIRPHMSTAFHPQTDGQTERLNQTIEAYLRAFVAKEQDDWVSLLPMAEFAYNNSVTTGNGMTPFFANYGFHPAAIDPPTEGPLNPASKIYAHWMQTVHEDSRQGLEAAQERKRRYTDPGWKNPTAYRIGDLVMLNGRNIKTRHPTKNWTIKTTVPSRSKKSSPRSPYASRCLRNGRSTTSSTFRYWNPTEPANTEHNRTLQKYSEKRTISNKARNTM